MSMNVFSISIVLLVLSFIVSGSGLCTDITEVDHSLYAQVLEDHYSRIKDTPTIDELTFREIDLNGDKINEYLVVGDIAFCGSRGCFLWIYKKSAGGYENIYNGDGAVRKDLENFEEIILETVTNGWPDLLFKSQPRGGGIFFIVSSFNGEAYVDYDPCKNQTR